MQRANARVQSAILTSLWYLLVTSSSTPSVQSAQRNAVLSHWSRANNAFETDWWQNWFQKWSIDTIPACTLFFFNRDPKRAGRETPIAHAAEVIIRATNLEVASSSLGENWLKNWKHWYAVRYLYKTEGNIMNYSGAVGYNLYIFKYHFVTSFFFQHFLEVFSWSF